MSDRSQVFLNGEFVPYGEACVPIEDRGFNFADGIYEVVRITGGNGFRLGAHLDRLEMGAGLLEIPLPLPRPELRDRLLETARRNRIEEGTLYLQLTRGVAPRSHAFPSDPRPTLLIMARPFSAHPEERFRDGVAAVTEPDRRWELCEVKTIGLLPNVLAAERARRAGALEAILVRGEHVTEGSHSTVFAVVGGEVRTHPVRNILPGITRRLVIDRLGANGISVREAAVSLEEIQEASEIFLTGTTTEVMPVTRLDGAEVGDGRPGDLARLAHRLYREELAACRAGGASSEG